MWEPPSGFASSARPTRTAAAFTSDAATPASTLDLASLLVQAPPMPVAPAVPAVVNPILVVPAANVESAPKPPSPTGKIRQPRSSRG
jgi:hypothetical protein